MCWANSDGATNHLVCFRHFILLHFRFQANHEGLAAGPIHIWVVVASDHPLLLRQLATNVYAWDLHLLAPKFLEVEIAIWLRGFLRKEPSSTQRMDKVFDVDASNKVHHVVQRAVAIIVLTATRNARLRTLGIRCKHRHLKKETTINMLHFWYLCIALYIAYSLLFTIKLDFPNLQWHRQDNQKPWSLFVEWRCAQSFCSYNASGTAERYNMPRFACNEGLLQYRIICWFWSMFQDNGIRLCWAHVNPFRNWNTNPYRSCVFKTSFREGKPSSCLYVLQKASMMRGHTLLCGQPWSTLPKIIHNFCCKNINFSRSQTRKLYPFQARLQMLKISNTGKDVYRCPPLPTDKIEVNCFDILR